jgi:hypothetical protein
MKLLVIVPYRDRESHLKEFIPYITNTLTSQNIEYKILVVEQSPEKLFNRGLLCNIGFDLYKNEFDYICIHDVDIIGENFDYRYEPVITHLSARHKNRNYEEFYPKCLGGVVLFPKEDFLKVNGFSNEYWGWGVEDDDLRLRCDTMNVCVQRKQCKFYTLYHPTIPWTDRPQKSPGYINNLNKLNKLNKMLKQERVEEILYDGLNNVSNYHSAIDTIHCSNYTFIKSLI